MYSKNQPNISSSNIDGASVYSSHQKETSSITSFAANSNQKTSATTFNRGSSSQSRQTRPTSAQPQAPKTLLKPPRNESTVYFANNDGQLNLQTPTKNLEDMDQPNRNQKRKKRLQSSTQYERRITQPGRYLERAKNQAIQNRHRLIARQGELLNKEHLDECQLAGKLALSRALDENRKLRSQLNTANQKLHTKSNLLQDNLNCTFVACPCSKNAKVPNMQLIFKLRKKVMELRDLCATQEVELINIKNSQKYIKIKDLMVEIEALRALVAEKEDNQFTETEQLKQQVSSLRQSTRASESDIVRDLRNQIRGFTRDIEQLRVENQKLRSSSDLSRSLKDQLNYEKEGKNTMEQRLTLL